MFDDADDLGISAVKARGVETGEVHKLEAFSDGILAGPGAVGEKFIDHGDEGMFLVVLIGKITPVDQLYTDGFKIAVRDDAPVGGDAFPGLFGGSVVSVGCLRAAAAQREAIDDADGFDSGNITHTVLKLSGEFDDVFKLGVAVERNV